MAMRLATSPRRYMGPSLVRNRVPLGPYSSICLGPYGGPKRAGGSCERGTPVQGQTSKTNARCTTQSYNEPLPCNSTLQPHALQTAGKSGSLYSLP